MFSDVRDVIIVTEPVLRTVKFSNKAYIVQILYIVLGSRYPKGSFPLCIILHATLHAPCGLPQGNDNPVLVFCQKKKPIHLARYKEGCTATCLSGEWEAGVGHDAPRWRLAICAYSCL